MNLIDNIQVKDNFSSFISYSPLLALQDEAILYSARPGARLWEVDLKGDAEGNLKGSCIKTFQFKSVDKPPSDVIAREDVALADGQEDLSDSPNARPQLSGLSGVTSFPRLVAAESDLVFTIVKETIFVIDPKSYTVR